MNSLVASSIPFLLPRCGAVSSCAATSPHTATQSLLLVKPAGPGARAIRRRARRVRKCCACNRHRPGRLSDLLEDDVVPDSANWKKRFVSTDGMTITFSSKGPQPPGSPTEDTSLCSVIQLGQIESIVAAVQQDENKLAVTLPDHHYFGLQVKGTTNSAHPVFYLCYADREEDRAEWVRYFIHLLRTYKDKVNRLRKKQGSSMSRNTSMANSMCSPQSASSDQLRGMSGRGLSRFQDGDSMAATTSAAGISPRSARKEALRQPTTVTTSHGPGFGSMIFSVAGEAIMSDGSSSDGDYYLPEDGEPGDGQVGATDPSEPRERCFPAEQEILDGIYGAMGGNRWVSLIQEACEKESPELRLDYCKLAVVPLHMLNGLTNLRSLIMTKNEITHLPEEFGIQMHFLEELNLNENKISKLPASIGLLHRLVTFECGQNELEDLPAEFKNLVNLRQLVIDYNQFKQVPEVIFELPGLESLFCMGNRGIKTLPTAEQFSVFSELQVTIDNHPNCVLQWKKAGPGLPAVTISWNKVFPTRITPFLWVGSVRTVQSPEIYQELGVTHILTAGRNIAQNMVVGDCTHMVLQLDDSQEEELRPHLLRVVEFIDQCRLAGGSCIVHCSQGVSRSTSMCTTYLMREYGLTFDQGLKLVKTAHPPATPNPSFTRQLRTLEDKVVSKELLPWDAKLSSAGSATGQHGNSKNVQHLLERMDQDDPVCAAIFEKIGPLSGPALDI